MVERSGETYTQRTKLAPGELNEMWKKNVKTREDAKDMLQKLYPEFTAQLVEAHITAMELKMMNLDLEDDEREGVIISKKWDYLDEIENERILGLSSRLETDI